MADVRFTPDQQKAIDTLDKSILVSAAAGSGKTAVLVERIINIILQGEADVDEMLVVTFTNAAASEMRLKLAKAIRKHIKEHPETAPKLKAQLNKLYKAYISTFNSFAIRVIREFFYEVDIEPGFKVCDEVKGEILRRESIDELFELAFACDDYVEGGSFREFLRLYSSDRNEDGIKAELLATYQKLRSMPNYFEWAYDNAEILKLDAEGFLRSKAGELMFSQLKENLLLAYQDAVSIRDILEAEGLSAVYTRETDKTQSLATEGNQFVNAYNLIQDDANPLDIITAVQAMHFDRLPTPPKEFKDAFNQVKEEIKEIRDHYKKLVGAWIDVYLLPDFETRIRELNESYRYTRYYLRLLEHFEDIYSARKNELGLMDFSDMEHTASAILRKPEIADTLRRRFKFIFIDEYQDTNNIQEYLINSFARTDNVFKVGDVKQSIYKFRQAEPAIFEGVKADYSRADNTNAISINLNQNFRSNARTLAYVNAIFANIMEGYDDDAALKPGLSFEGRDEYDFTPEAHILIDYSKELAKESSSEAADESDDLALETIRTLSKEEAEAKYIAGLVNSIIGREFYDSKIGIVRQATARDITILMRSVKVKGDAYVHALRDYSIDSHIDEEADYFDTIEIRTAFSMLQTIDNGRKDVPLIATLHSEVFGFSAEELAVIRAEYRHEQASCEELKSQNHYYHAVEWYEINGIDELLKEKLHKALDKLRHFRALAKILPLDQFIWKLLVDSNYYLYAGAIRGGSRRQANLRSLLDRASKFSKENIATLSDFISYLEVMQTRRISTGQISVNSKDDDLVKITTIHKSKGLEYPFVIVAGLGQRLMYDKASRNCIFDSKLGLSSSYVDPSLKFWRSTLLQRIILENSNNEAYKEELRVLYVAMTRARNQLYLVGTVDSTSLNGNRYRSRGSFLEIIGDSISTPFNKTIRRELNREDTLSHQSRLQQILDSRTKLDPAEVQAELEAASLRLDYEYPDKDVLTRPSKISVSTLRKEELEAQNEAEARASASEEETYNLWKAVQYKKVKASRANIGTAYHRIMEYLDFSRVIADDGSIDETYLNDSAQTLVLRGAIDSEIFKSVKLDRIAAFFKTSLGIRAAEAARDGRLYKEKPFTLKIERDDHPLMVQGVIDCCFIENGSFVLVDYKSNYIDYSRGLDAALDNLKAEYKPQIDTYKQAIEEGSGIKVNETYLYLFGISKALDMN